ncbi:acrylyl-CoA reductase (NADPH) [Devosia sp. YR412]|uniref:acrylyl-CoA reductase family protein n=1 Tax=Devosia sp. YR412 TaxID=1881030 RepID=UPI0008BEFCD3|nr:acryloyl-CoA reductase [Devosia sp. YR412]SEP67660.1 acrylyl-CoA reductase (NADPH) [Devosia sp. YR412]
MSFRALLTEKAADGTITSSVQTLDEGRLPEGNVTVAVDWAGLNYKDGLILTGAGNMIKAYPHVAGIDFSGTVSASEDWRFHEGDKVLLTGWRVGESHWGGYAETARVNGDWLVPLPKTLSARDAMVLGTAGLTAMLAVDRLEAAGVSKSAGPILVTGAAGGVGTIAISLLAKLGYEVAALSGRPQHAEALKALGATTIVDRAAFLAEPDKPLEAARWAGAVDNVGGALLGKLLKQVHYDGVVASIGMAGGTDLPTNVLPFILRGVTLVGIDSVMRPTAPRVAAWQRLGELFDAEAYSGLVEEIGLEGLPEAAKRILAGEVRGRVLVEVR